MPGVARLSQAARREAILDATLAVAARKGLGATTARDVAAEMRTSSGLIHHYFDSMDELLAAAFERAVGADLVDLHRVTDAAAGSPAKLRAFLATFERSDDDFPYQLWLDAWSEAVRHPLLRQTSQRLNVAWHTRLEDIIRVGVAAGELVCDDPAGAAWRILSLLDGFALQVIAHPDAVDETRVLPWTQRMTEFEVGLPAGSLAEPSSAR